MKELVIKIKYGGLGDHLLWSPIPRLAKQKHGYDKVFISNFSNYRNINTKRLVWEYNPYVDGFVDVDVLTPEFSTTEEGKNIIDAHIDFIGLPDDGDRFREPEIYYKPKIIEVLKECKVYDPNYITDIVNPMSFEVERYFKENNIKIDYQMKFMFNTCAINNIQELAVSDLEGYCDVIYSCKYFYCVMSGASSLVSALKKRSVIFYNKAVNPMFLHSKLQTYILL